MQPTRWRPSTSAIKRLPSARKCLKDIIWFKRRGNLASARETVVISQQLINAKAAFFLLCTTNNTVSRCNLRLGQLNHYTPLSQA